MYNSGGVLLTRDKVLRRLVSANSRCGLVLSTTDSKCLRRRCPVDLGGQVGIVTILVHR